MNMLLGLIESLELNSSLGYQFLIFLVAYLFLYYVLFKPYNAAAQKRYELTVGSEAAADEFDEEIELLKRKYGQKVKETNSAVKEVHAQQDLETKKAVNDILVSSQEAYRSEKAEKEKTIQDSYENEKAKVPSLVGELKEAFKKVLIGA